MPDWAQEIIRNNQRLGPVIGVGLISYYCYRVFAFVEDRLSVSAKQEITAWLKSAKVFAANQTLSFSLPRFHSELFGSKQLSIQCLVRTTLFSLTSFLIISLPSIIVSNIYMSQRYFTYESVKYYIPTVLNVYVFVLFATIVLPLDFFGVAVTRKLSALAGNKIVLINVALIFIFDTLTKAVVFPILFSTVIFIFSAFIYKFFLNEDLTGFFDIPFLRGYVETIRPTIVKSYLMLLPAFLLCSAWVWLYFVGIRVVRVAIFLFDVDKQPVRSIGIVGAAVLIGCYGLYTMMVGGYAAQGLLGSGLVYAFEEDYDSAIADFNEAIRLDPKLAAAFSGRGLAYASKEDYDRAIADYNQAIRLDPKLAAAFSRRGLAYAARQDYDRAIADYNEAIRLDPKLAAAFSNRGFAYASKQDYDRAIADCNEAIRLDPTLAAAFSNRGLAYASKEDYDRAIADYNKAIRLDPKLAAAFFNRGLAYATRGASGELGIEVTQEDGLIKVVTPIDDSPASRAGILSGDIITAIDGESVQGLSLHQAVAKMRGAPDTSVTLKIVRGVNRDPQDVKLTRHDRAIADYAEAIRLDPKLAAAFSGRGLAYASKEEYDRAIADYAEAIRLDPKLAAAFFGRGLAYTSEEDYDRAIADYNEAIRLDPKSASAFHWRGYAYAAEQDYDRAIADYNEAIRLDPKFAYPVLWLYLARARARAQTAATELETHAKNLKQPDWPYPVVELFLGRRTPEATLAAATKPDDRCEAQFYVGEWRLLRGNRRAAMVALKAAAETCPTTSDGYDLARAELHRLGR